jgi:hypothetical protein
MAMEFMCGLTTDAMKDSGRTIKCMVEEFLLGLMVENMKEIITMIKNREEVYSHGQMVENMMENGIMENNMVMGYITHLKERLREESGKMEKE